MNKKTVSQAQEDLNLQMNNVSTKHKGESDRDNTAEQASPTDFLKKTEARRNKRECVRVIDMRGRVPYECKNYIYKKRVFWMDDISYEIFLRGLKKNNRIFTNQMFEDIVNGPHTNHKSQQKTPAPSKGKVKQLTPSSYHENTHKIEGKDAELFNLGYYQKRQETRLRHTTEILIQTATTSVSAKTKDISATGFKCSFTKPVKINKGDEVYITYTAFNSSYQCQLIKIRYEITYMVYN